MDAQRTRLLEDLAGLLDGELRCDPTTVGAYATDAGVLEQVPLGVAFPRHREDVVVLAKYAAEHRLPLIPRGAGTTQSGSALGAGIVVDFARFMNAVVAVDDETVRVQPGVVLQQLDAPLRRMGRYFPPDPANAVVSTVGGAIGVNAGGSHAVRVGTMRDHVTRLELVLSDGTVMPAGAELIEPVSSEPASDTELAHRGRVQRLARLLQTYDDLIREENPGNLWVGRSGYCLRGLMTTSQLHLPRLITGSEGTLALVTEATLHTSPLPPHRGAVCLFFGSMGAAARAAQATAPLEPTACDLLDRRLLSVARERDERFAAMIPVAAEAALLLEFAGDTPADVEARLAMFVRAVGGLQTGFTVGTETTDPAEVDFLWTLLTGTLPVLERVRHHRRASRLFDGLAVPVEALGESLLKVQHVLQKHQINAVLYAHAATGQIHVRPLLEPVRPADGPWIEALQGDLYEVVDSVGGSFGACQGLGSLRGGYLSQCQPRLAMVYDQIKEIFDPLGILNPDVLRPDTELPLSERMRNHELPAEPLTELQLEWAPRELQETTEACNSCGRCRTQLPGERMCPFFREEPEEVRSPRSKANVLRRFLQGKIDADDFGRPEAKTLVESCFNCKQCQIECPSQVNVPHVAIEIRAQAVALNGLSKSDWFLAHPDLWGPWGCRFARLLNPLLNRRGFRWFLSKVAGVAAKRRLPTFAPRTFLELAPKKWLERPAPGGPPPVVYFVDHFAMYHDPELALAWGRILEHFGFAVHVPRGQATSGMALISAGDLNAAREIADRNLRALADLARDGSPIVCTEPTAVVCLKSEYPRLFDHPDAAVVAEKVVEAGAFLKGALTVEQWQTASRPAHGKPLKAAYHVPCHLRALGADLPFFELCRQIPNLELERIERGCSSMAGVYGLSARTFDRSIAQGKALMEEMASRAWDIGVTECSGCRLQMQQKSPVPTLHPIKLMALALGLMPELQNRFRPNNRRLVTT